MKKIIWAVILIILAIVLIYAPARKPEPGRETIIRYTTENGKTYQERHVSR